MKKEPRIGFNKKWAKSVTEKVFLDEHKQLVTDGFITEPQLKDAYKKIVGTPPKKAESEPAKES